MWLLGQSEGILCMFWPMGSRGIGRTTLGEILQAVSRSTGGNGREREGREEALDIGSGETHSAHRPMKCGVLLATGAQVFGVAERERGREMLFKLLDPCVRATKAADQPCQGKRLSPNVVSNGRWAACFSLFKTPKLGIAFPEITFVHTNVHLAGEGRKYLT